MDPELPHALQVWDNAARLGLPLWLKAWLGLLALTFLASLAFVRHHVPARVAAAGFAASHALVIAIEQGGVTTLRTGLVSVTHVIGWTPVLVALVRAAPASDPRTAYGVWCRMLLAIVAIALVFDYRDAVAFLYHQATGHPALVAGDAP